MAAALSELLYGRQGICLNGLIVSQAEEPSDRGTIFVKDGAIEIVDDVIYKSGPSWEPVHYASLGVLEAIRALAESADSTGCTPDLPVVTSKPVAALITFLP